MNFVKLFNLYSSNDVMRYQRCARAVISHLIHRKINAKNKSRSLTINDKSSTQQLPVLYMKFALNLVQNPRRICRAK